MRTDFSIYRRWPIWNSLDRTGECWIWMGSVGSHGYGQVNRRKQIRLVHRVAYEEAFGRIPDGHFVDHKCCERRCCRPSHLHAVTPKRNAELMAERGGSRRKETHCKHGHEFTEINTYWLKGRRYCRACGNRRTATWYRKRKARSDLFV